MSVVLEAAQGAIAQEFSISERLDAKANVFLASAAAWFAVVGGIGGALFTRNDRPSDVYVDVVIALALAALVFLIGLLVRSIGVLGLRREAELAPSALREMAAVARDPNDDLGEKLVRHYTAVLASRRENNKNRADALRETTVWWLATLLLTLAEFVAVLVAAAWG